MNPTDNERHQGGDHHGAAAFSPQLRQRPTIMSVVTDPGSLQNAIDVARPGRLPFWRLGRAMRM